MAVMGADPVMVALRERLVIARLAGRPFPEAWPAAQAGLLDGLPSLDAIIYRGALAATADAWRGAYERQPTGRVDRAVSELHAYVADGELDAMRHEPAA